MAGGARRGLVFSVIDPSELRWFGHVPIAASAQAVYTLHRSSRFWAVISASGALTALLWKDRPLTSPSTTVDVHGIDLLPAAVGHGEAPHHGWP